MMLRDFSRTDRAPGAGLASGLQLAAVFATALMLWLAYPGGGELWPLLFVALVPFFVVVMGAKTARQAALLGMLLGLVHFAALLYWIVIVLGHYGGLPVYLAVAALLLLALYMSLYLGVFAMVARLFFLRCPASCALWLIPAAWVALDWCRSFLFSGLPWMDPGYGLARVPWLLQSADLWGHYGLSFILVLLNTLIALLCRAGIQKKGQLGLILPVLLLCAGVALYSFLRWQQIGKEMGQQVQRGATMRVGVVQGNIAQDQKWSPGLQEKALATYFRQTRDLVAQDRPVLVIWPETALPFYPSAHPLMRVVRDFAGQENISLLTGAPWVETASEDKRPGGETSQEKGDRRRWIDAASGADGGGAAGNSDRKKPRYYNSALLINPHGSLIDGYSKSHLVPYGEYVPLKKMMPFLAPLVEAAGDFSPGAVSHALDCQNARIGVLICFESIFPEIARKWVGVRANLLVNLTNDAWYGRSSAPHHSLAMTVLRAVETRRSLVRAANTGFSGFIDPLGQVQKVSPLFEPWAGTAELVLMEEETWFVRWGYLFSPICLILVLLFLGWIALRNPCPRRFS
jgi:apolipoprotein N-acyltransferase